MTEKQPTPQEEPKLQTPEALEELKVKIKSEILNETKAENRKRGLLVTMGVLLGAGAGIGISFYWNTIGGWFNILVGAAVIGILFVGLLLYFLLFFKSSILAKVFGVGKASYEDIFSTLYKPAQELVEKNLPSATYEQKVNPYLQAIEKGGRQLIAYQSFRRTRRMLFGLFISLVIGLGGIVGTVLILRQNKLLEVQNQLVEGQRRSSLIFMMSNIMDKVDEEIKVQKEALRKEGIDEVKIDSTTWKLSDPLIGRLAALNQAFKPHRYIDGDSLISLPLSPERGQLLTALVKSNLDTATYRKIFASMNFRQADLAYANFQGAFLEYIDLSGANLRYANFIGANLIGAGLYSADLSDSDLEDADLTDAEMTSANLRDAYMVNSDLSFVYLMRGNLKGADLRNANLTETDLVGADLTRTDFQGANFEETRILGLDDLLTVRSLYKAENLPADWIEYLKEQKPDLFQDPMKNIRSKK